ncbi:MAG: hypothetical protein KCHDKBKB_02270 [Elusimicrobia bacterium]|nr:hypothetical protein [Elusimicrobiota bacterium]
MNNRVPVLPKKTATLIYIWLVGLTLAEVAIAFVNMPKLAGTILLGGTTLAKTLMIGLYFMHLKHDRPVAWLLPVVPVLLAILFTAVLFPDMVYHLPLSFQ